MSISNPLFRHIPRTDTHRTPAVTGGSSTIAERAKVSTHHHQYDPEQSVQSLSESAGRRNRIRIGGASDVCAQARSTRRPGAGCNGRAGDKQYAECGDLQAQVFDGSRALQYIDNDDDINDSR